jgi:hypothetical protein
MVAGTTLAAVVPVASVTAARTGLMLHFLGIADLRYQEPEAPSPCQQQPFLHLGLVSSLM